LEKQLEKYHQHYISWSSIKVQVLTWNCAGNTPSATFDISNILLDDSPGIVPDVYIIGLQEMVKLNAKSVIQGKDKERVLLWEQIITRSITSRGEGHRYVCIARKPMVGCFILLFARDEHKHKINNIRTSRVKTGFGGQSGNKGSVAIRFNYANSSFAFINCHLTSG
jgi:synaptojanin